MQGPDGEAPCQGPQDRIKTTLNLYIFPVSSLFLPFVPFFPSLLGRRLPYPPYNVMPEHLLLPDPKIYLTFTND